MQAKDRVIAALDFTDGDLALELAGRLREWVGLFKVGLPLIVGSGFSIVDRLRREGHAVVLDLKYHDLPDRVESAVRAAARKGTAMVTVQALGGSDMLKASMRSLSEMTIIPGVPPPRIIATTVFSHVAREALEQVGFGEDPRALSLRLARLALDAGVDGVMVSPRWAAEVRELAGPDALILCPGIRAPGDTHDAHGIEAAEAIRAGASHVIVGAPLRRASDPQALARSIVEEIAHVAA
ncbi:MAG: orotidine-5'-phosphate decarboxylase [Pseudomonadota bacterium]